jgi:hypothetical protein
MSESVALPKAENEEVAFAFREIVTNVIEQGKFDSEQFVEVCYLKSKEASDVPHSGFRDGIFTA